MSAGCPHPAGSDRAIIRIAARERLENALMDLPICIYTSREMPDGGALLPLLLTQEGGEGWGEEARFVEIPLSPDLSPLVPRGERGSLCRYQWICLWATPDSRQSYSAPTRFSNGCGLATRPGGRTPGPSPDMPRSASICWTNFWSRATTSGFCAATSLNSPISVSRL